MIFKKFLSAVIVLIMLTGMIPSTVTAATECLVEGNVIDISDKTVYERKGLGAAKVVDIRISGAEVKCADEDNTNINIVLDSNTEPDACIGIEFGTALDRNMNMSGHNASVCLSDGTISLDMTLKGQYSSMSSLSGTAKYTLNFSVDVPSFTPPTRIAESDSLSTYSGVAIAIKLKDYFDDAKNYYLVNGEEKTPIDGGSYTFKSFDAGVHILIFASSNNNGECPDFVTVSIEVSEIKSGAYLGITISNGSVNFVKFTDANGNDIDGITAYLEDKSIIVNLPRTIGINSKITATFDLTQNNGLPKLSTSNAFNGSNDTKIYNTTLSGGSGTATMYLYNAHPKATNNTYTSYSVIYAIENKPPTLSEGQEAFASADIASGEEYTLDLSNIFSDADGDELRYSVKINGANAVDADSNYCFTPTLGGTYVLEFFANDSMAESLDFYSVTLTVKNSDKSYCMTVSAPEDASPEFYITTGFDDNGTDIPGDKLTFSLKATANGYSEYLIYVPKNIKLISVRDQSYGGLALDATSDGNAKLCRVQAKIIDFGNNEIPGTITTKYLTHTAKPGTNGFFLLAKGAEYLFFANPQNTSAYNTASQSAVLSEDTDNVYIKVSYKNPKTIITASNAEAKLFKYTDNYYVHTAINPLASVDNADGTTTHYFAAEGNLSYRVSAKGKLTKAGYLLSGNTAKVLHSESDLKPHDRVDYSTAGTNAASVADDSLLLNINKDNHLSLTVGQNKTIKAYRAWEIINNYLNHVIMPDFHFSIVSGEDVVKITPYENQPMTNGSGNWCTLTATGEGTAVIEVSYDAIQISGGSYDGFYGACDDARCGLFVVTVGEEVPMVDFGIKSKTSTGSIVYNEANAKPWDSEFDTVYFFGDTGEIKLSPTLPEGSINEVAVSADKGKNFTVIQNIDGVYTAPITAGNNIIKVSTNKGTAYKIVRGDKIGLLVKNITNPDKPIAHGDKIELKLTGVHTPVPKISGTYNPGYSANADGESKTHIRYSLRDDSIISEGKQYDFSQNGTTLKFTVPQEADKSEFTLTDGYIGVGVIGVTGFSDNGDSHRNIPDAGSGTRDNKTSFTTRSLLPDITVSVGMLPSNNTAPFIRENAPKTATVNLGATYAVSMAKIFSDREGDTLTYTAKLGESDTTAVEDAYYTYTPQSVGTYQIDFVANDGKSNSDTHTITLNVKEKSATSSTTGSVEYDISGDEIAGYVNISFTDNGKRVQGETNVTYPKALGTIISSKRVPYRNGDTVADVTLRLLDALGFSYQHTGSTKRGFYLASIGNFTLKGISYETFGEFDAGVGSGWMITLNKKFIEYGASDFEVKNGDNIKWQYTCQLGQDIGDTFYTGASSSGSKSKADDKKTDDKEENKDIEPEVHQKLDFTENTFADVKKDDWYYEYVKYVYENNFMQGTDKGFEPDSKMTRAMLITVLFRMTNAEDVKYTHSFADVNESTWYSDAVAWAASNGIINGITSTEFAPDDNVSREQMALIIYRFAKMQGYDTDDKADILNFTDTSDISNWALDAVAWAASNKIINGTDKNTLLPKSPSTRAQVAAVLTRFIEKLHSDN